mgnify:CR=1 FL=1
MSEKFQAVVIGGGPGGYVCAIRLAQLGLKTACIESRGSLGGTCLNVGCIPSKSLLNLSEEFHKVQNLSSKGIEVGEVKLNLEKMMKSKDKAVTILTKGVEFLLKKNKVTYYKGTGSFKSQNEIIIKDDQNKETIIEAEKTVIATGSVPVSLPGIEIDEKVIVSSTGALKLDKVPKKMVVVGGGYIGLEMGSVWSRLGAEVQVVEFLDHITPGMDKEISSEFMKILKKQGIKFNMQNKVEAIQNNKTGAVVSTVDKDGKKNNFDCDVVLISVGRKANTNGLNLEAAGVELDERKRVKTDNTFKTNINNIYAIGDVISGPMLAHKAEDEGIAVAENIAGQSGHVNYDTIPGVVYTTPEVASIGKTEEQLKELNTKYKIGKFSFMANSRAKAIDDAEGFVKILADEKTDKVLGAHIIGPHAGELIAEIGINHGGDLQNAIKLIKQASIAKVWGVKFQYRSDNFFADNHEMGSTLIKSELERSNLKHSWIDELIKISHENGLNIGFSFFRNTDLEEFYRKGYKDRQSKGLPQRQLSKEFVRQWLIENNFQGLKNQKPPMMTKVHINDISQRYIELYEQIIGEKFEKPSNQNITDRIRKNISLSLGL